jgi:tetratricopeptide (TPR) repeat protein
MKTLLLVSALVVSLSSYSQNGLNNATPKSEYSYQYALIEASRQKMIGNVNEAISLYLSCIKSNPECDVAYYELGTVYSATGENAKAEENLAAAFKLNEKNYWYGIAYSELLKINGNSSKSLKVLKKTKKLNKSNSLTVDFKIAEIYTESKKYSMALDLLERIEKDNGVSELISFKKLEIYKLQKDFKNAEAVLNNLIAKAPDEAEYQILKAEYLVETGDSLRALMAYEMAFNIDSSNIYAITNLADMYSSMGDDDKAYYYLNQAFMNNNIPVGNKIQTMIFLNKDRDMIKKNASLIDKMVNSLVLQYPDNIDVKTVAYDFYNGLENNEKALEIIKDILLTKKDDYIIWQQALYNASMLENYDELITIGEEALKYFPNKNELFLFVGMAYFQKENFEKAYSILNVAYPGIKEGDKIKMQFLIFLSESAYKAGHKTEAYLFYDQLILEDPSNDFTKNNYSYYLALDSADLIKAKTLSYATILNSPENATFLDTYAWILFKLGDFENAKFYSEKALLINAESDPDLILHYADILNALTKTELAEKYYKLALEKGYDKQIIERKIKNLSQKK